MPAQPGPSRRTIVALLIMYLLSVGTSVTFLSHSIGFHSQSTKEVPATVPIGPAPMLGKHPVVVYLYNHYSNQKKSAISIKDGFLAYYDVRTKQNVEVLKLANTFIYEAQVSPDGQWILFLVGGYWPIREPYHLQRMRINGQQRETLYTFPDTDYDNRTSRPAVSVEWSLDQRSVLIATDRNNATSTLSILDMATRKLRTVLQITSAQYGYYMEKWLDETHIYVSASERYHGQKRVASMELYLLDITAPQARSASDLKLILPRTQENSLTFDSSPDGKRLFFAEEAQGNVTIWVEPATGGKRQVLSHIIGAPFRVYTLRVFTNDLLLAVSFGGEKHNEVWRMPLDASSHTTLFKSTDYTVYVLNRMTKYSWSNVSRDKTMLALETYNRDIGPPRLFVSPIQEGKATVFGNSGYAFIVGWATI